MVVKCLFCGENSLVINLKKDIGHGALKGYNLSSVSYKYCGYQNFVAALRPCSSLLPHSPIEQEGWRWPGPTP